MMMMGMRMESDERWERSVERGWNKRLMKKIIEEGNCEEEDDDE